MKLDASLKHSLEPQSQWKGNLRSGLKIFVSQLTIHIHTLVVTKPEKCQLIQPPTTTMGTIEVRFPFNISVIMLGSIIGLGGGVALCVPFFSIPVSSWFM